MKKSRLDALISAIYTFFNKTVSIFTDFSCFFRFLWHIIV